MVTNPTYVPPTGVEGLAPQASHSPAYTNVDRVGTPSEVFIGKDGILWRQAILKNTFNGVIRIGKGCLGTELICGCHAVQPRKEH